MGHLVRVRRRPSAAMVVALVALIVASGGTAVAASQLVSGDSLIKKNSLSGNRLRNRSVAGSKIKLGSLGTVPRAAHAATADSATTAVNATSAASAPIAKLTYVTTTFTVPGDGTATTGTAPCPAGTDVTGGGGSIDDTVNGFFLGSFPAGKTGWSVLYEEETGGASSATGTVYAICAPAAATAP
ncbi:MAG: hypothetical protein JO027_12385 [Solirubrobacterales bacterium]|nr:hypothetical protein [Solirubrobacterales bacterium]